ncbi:MAG: Rne/Rng family ribonuclease [Prevotellaceae bacterium]|jgi:ribonuclease G|nr:Rne/Rng family ribonuclease [Prevotellaceae bacterium]
MTKELVIDVQQETVSIALLEDKRLVELNRDNLKQNYEVGNIYLGRVKRILTGLNAAFVDIGSDKEAFIHYHDLGENFPAMNNIVKQILNDKKRTPRYEKLPCMEKDGSIRDVLTVGQMILVQIIKEPISTKGARVSSEISIAGRYMVMLPFVDNRTSVSQKIRVNAEKTRLKQLVHSIKPTNFSVIIRTVADGKRVAELDGEIKVLKNRWDKTLENLRKSTGIGLLSQESSRVVSNIRDLFDEEYENIHVNDNETFKEIQDYIQLIAPDKKDIVKLYEGEFPIYDNFGVTRQIKVSFGRVVSFKRGAYLIMDQTEAMFVVDVNSGTRIKASQNHEDNALEVNLLAAEEIARQLRLRDIGGLVVIDFIDMLQKANMKKVCDYMYKMMSTDRAKHNILPLSKFCLMEITRQRVRPAIAINTNETCPTCFGTGKSKPSILFTNQLENKIHFIVNELEIKKFTLCVHPFIEAYINKGFVSQRRRWRIKYSRGIRVIPMQELGFLQYKFLDKNRNEIDLTVPN